jgi:hypothetical protein
MSERCAHHPDRPGHALCMACRQVVCEECATEWDGINYCAACLARKRGARKRRPSLPRLLLLALVSAGLFALSARLMVWAGVLFVSL